MIEYLKWPMALLLLAALVKVWRWTHRGQRTRSRAHQRWLEHRRREG